MFSLLVFDRICRMEIQSVMLVFSIPLVNYSAPLTFSLVHLSPLPPSVWIHVIHTVCNRGEWMGGPQADKHLPPSTFTCQFFKKNRHLGFGVFIDIWPMSVAIQSLKPTESFAVL
jgi:hypothetical protein